MAKIPVDGSAQQAEPRSGLCSQGIERRYRAGNVRRATRNQSISDSCPALSGQGDALTTLPIQRASGSEFEGDRRNGQEDAHAGVTAWAK